MNVQDTKIAEAMKQGAAQFESVREMVERLRLANGQDVDAYAMVSAQGTACLESVLIGREDTVENRKRAETRYCVGGSDDPLPNSWARVSENEACWPSVDDAERAIHEDALSVTVRSGWYAPGAREDAEPAEYEILLCTGGPACRMIGELDGGQPSNARIEVQDWFTPWVEWRGEGWDEEIALDYARQFYFGD